MTTHPQALTGFLTAGAVLVVSMGLAEAAERTSMTYDIHLGGMNVAQANMILSLDKGEYTMDSDVRTRGLAATLTGYSTTARSVGSLMVRDGTARPRTHISNSTWRGKDRSVDIAYGPIDSPPRIAVSPEPVEDEREPVPEAARAGTVDPMSGALILMLNAATQATTNADTDTPSALPVPIFDGRRLYSLAVGDMTPRQVRSDAYVGAGWEAVMTYERQGGASSRRSMFSRDGDRKTGEATVHLAPGAQFGLPMPVPVRIQVDTESFGSLIVSLSGAERHTAARPATQNACTAPC